MILMDKVWFLGLLLYINFFFNLCLQNILKFKVFNKKRIMSCHGFSPFWYSQIRFKTAAAILVLQAPFSYNFLYDA